MKTRTPLRYFTVCLGIIGSLIACTSNDQRFSNPPYAEDNNKSLLDVFKWKVTEGPAANWPDWIDVPPREYQPKELRSNQIRAIFINHATVLLEMGDFNILTDPIWSQRASPVPWAGPKRVRPPGIEFNQLPPIDAVILSHNHYDHFDVKTLRMLAKEHDPIFIMGLKNGQILERNNIEANIVELDWSEKYRHNNSNDQSIEFIFKPAQHWSKRTLTDDNKMLWGSFVIRTQSHKVYFAGDSGHSPHFQKIGEKHGPFDLALLPVGAYNPRWFMKISHINPEEAVLAHNELKAKTSIAIHFGTFQLSDEGRDEPKFDLIKALRELELPKEQFIIPEFGGSYIIESF